jgi:hypothetical protein
MKKIIFILSSLLLALSLYANEISSYSTLHHYAKPGAPVDMSYTSQKVDVNETSDVNITLSTTIKQGTISTSITLDEGLISLKPLDSNLTFNVTPQQQTFLINTQVKAPKEGLYYIRLLTKVDKGYGAKLRSFAVPVYVGKNIGVKKHHADVQMKLLDSGENISVSKAIETIEVINE